MCFTSSMAESDDGSSPVDSMVFRMFEEIGRHQDIVVRKFSELANTEQERADILSVRPLSSTGPRSLTGETPDQSLNCIGCQVVAFII